MCTQYQPPLFFFRPITRFLVEHMRRHATDKSGQPSDLRRSGLQVACAAARYLKGTVLVRIPTVRSTFRFLTMSELAAEPHNFSETADRSGEGCARLGSSRLAAAAASFCHNEQQDTLASPAKPIQNTYTVTLFRTVFRHIRQPRYHGGGALAGKHMPAREGAAQGGNCAAPGNILASKCRVCKVIEASPGIRPRTRVSILQGR